MCRFYVDTVTRNIEHLLEGEVQTVWLNEAATWSPALLTAWAAKVRSSRR